MKWLSVGLAALAFSACVGDGVEFGGTTKPAPQQPSTIVCKVANFKIISQPIPEYPEDAMLFYWAAQKGGADPITLQYDITAAGETANIHFIGPPAYLRHSTRQKMIRAAADAVAQWRFEWVGPAGYSSGCKFTLYFTTDPSDD